MRNVKEKIKSEKWKVNENEKEIWQYLPISLIFVGIYELLSQSETMQYCWKREHVKSEKQNQYSAWYFL